MPKPSKDQILTSPLFSAESILNKRTNKKGLFYLIKWKGYPENKATWQNSEGLDNISDLIQAYQNRKNGKQVILKKDQLNKNSTQMPNFVPVDDFKLLHPIRDEENFEEKNRFVDYYNTLPINFQDGEASDTSQKGGFIQDNYDDSSSKRINKEYKETEIINNSIDISFQSKLIAKKFDNIVSKCNMPMISPFSKKKQKQMKQQIKGQRQTRGRKNVKSINKNAKNSKALTEQDFQTFQIPVFDEYAQRGKSANCIRKSAICASEVPKISTQMLIPSQGKIDIEDKKNTDLSKHLDEQANEIGSKIKTGYKISKQLKEQRNKSEVKEIRMIPRTLTKPSEFLVEYGTGELKVFQIIQLMIAHPMELVKHLEEGKSVYFS